MGGAVSGYHLKTWLEVPDLAEFLIFFTKKVPDNIATSRLKIGRSQVQLQLFKPRDGWNLNRLLRQPRTSQTSQKVRQFLYG